MAQPQHQLNIKMPEDQVAGVYADFVSVWHTDSAFTLDFAALVQPPRQTESGAVATDVQVVSRVRIPPAQVFEIMKALEVQLTAWEVETGRRPAEGIPPADGAQ